MSDEAPQSAFVRLASINVNEHVERKGPNKLAYLSWPWAIDQLFRADPDAEWVYGEPREFKDGTVMLYCTVTAFGKKRTAQLPVMDHNNKAIPNPNAFQVNTAMQRCLVKAIALHGLGLYLYAGEDLPEGERATEPEIPQEHVIALEAAESIDELQAAWLRIPQEHRKALARAKDAAKKRLLEPA